MKIKCIILFLFGVSLCACFDDKGNYDYRDMADITIENVPEVIEVLGNSDHIVVNPKVISSLEGEIGGDNTNFKFNYKIEKKLGGVLVSGQHWVDLNPSGSLDLDTKSAFGQDPYGTRSTGKQRGSRGVLFRCADDACHRKLQYQPCPAILFPRVDQGVGHGQGGCRNGQSRSGFDRRSCRTGNY